MSIYLELLENLVKAASGEGSRGGHVIGHTRTGKPIYSVSQHESHTEFNSGDHRDAMNHHYDVWSKTQSKIAGIREQNPNWNPPQEIHDFLKHHYTQMQMHQSRMNQADTREKQTNKVGAPAQKPTEQKKFQPIKYAEMSKSEEITPFYAAVVVVNPKEDKILLGKRTEDGQWTSPAGGAKKGEMPKQAAIREAFEEANLALKEEDLIELPMGYAHNDKPVHCFMVTLTPEQAKAISVVNDPDKEVKEWKWISLSDKLPEPMNEARFTTLTNAKMRLAGIVMKSYYNIDDMEGMTSVNPAEQASQRPHPMVQSIERMMDGYQPGDEPRRLLLNEKHILHLVKIDDGIYSGFVKKNEQEAFQSEVENVMNIDKMTIPDIVAMMDVKEILKEAPSPDVRGMAYAAEMDRLGEILAEQDKRSMAQPEEDQWRKLAEVLQSMTVNGDVNIIIQKAKALPVGTVRQWGVYKYVKHSDGWVVIGGEHHGKLMGNFKSEPKHGDYARHYQSSSPKQEETQGDSKESQAVESSSKEEKKEDKSSEHKKYASENAEAVKRAVDSKAHTMSQKAYMDHAMKQKIEELMKYNLREGADEETQKKTRASVMGYLERKKRTYNPIFKDQHRKHVETAVKAGLEVHPDALNDYPGLGGSDLPEGMDNELNSKTNLIRAVDFGNASKAVKKEFANHINECNKVVAGMGIKFKTPLTFRAKNLGKLGKRTRGSYYDRDKVIELADMSAANKTIMHEIGHAIDYAMAETGTRGRHQEMLRGGGTNPELKKLYDELHDVVTQSDYYNQSDYTHQQYLRTPTEVFARGFEVYSLQKAEELKVSEEFINTFVPDVFKTKDPEIEKIQKELRQLMLDVGNDEGREERNKRSQELRSQYFQKIEKTDKGWSVVPEERQAEYKKKVSEIMSKILSQDQIKKALEEIEMNFKDDAARGLIQNLQKSEAFQKGGLPVGSVRIWQGQKFIKQGDGHWAPLPANQQMGSQPQPQAQQPQAAQPKPEEKQPEAKQEEKGPIDHLKPQKGMGGHVEVHSKDLHHSLKHGPVSIISAGRNPNHEEDRALTDAHVNERYKRLEQDLQDHGYKYTKVKGHYGGEEESYMVYHADENHMNELGKKYNQDSVIHTKDGKNKLHFTTGENAGKHHKGESYQELPDAEDYYSHVKTADGKDTKFSLGLDFGKLHDAEEKKDTAA